MGNRVIFHIDMDAFFASVEQRENPEHRGKPVVVGADPEGGKGRGVVAACSYEARAFGVHSAMPIGRAFRLCPQAIFLRPNGAAYSHVSGAIMRILHRFTPVVEPISIDEAFLDMSGSERLYGNPLQAATQIKLTIRQEQKLTCSIGIAPNKFLAKIASDIRKPDGLFEVLPGTERDFLKDLPVSRIWGVGPKTEERLRFLGIATIGDVAARSKEFWIQRLGARGEHLWELSRGSDNRPMQPGSRFQSLSQERTFGKDTDDLGLLKETLLALSEEQARRARKHQTSAKTVSLKLRYADFSTFDRQRTLPQYTNDAQRIYAVAWNLLEGFFPLPQKVRLIGVGISHFQPADNPQLGLFEPPDQKKGRLNAGVDTIISRFGEESIRKASLLDTPVEGGEGFSSFLKK
ncbi:MAG TPA: DNA polymerase IV [Acidobacteriota bacterium]|jgi:nucleotidyltransferase/DNA polymerase involved in DNA repair|nr:DNA polymerase IV [Acidobacteriota bacterium]